MKSVLFKNCAYLITDPSVADSVIENGALLVNGPFIKTVCPSDEIGSLIGDLSEVDVVDCTGKIVMPGLVDSHNHIPEHHMYLNLGLVQWNVIRGIIDSLHKLVWPPQAWMTAQVAYDLNMVGLMHLLKHGTTTTANAFHFPEEMAKAAEHARMRMVLHPMMVTSIRWPHSKSESEYLAETEAVIKNYHNALDGLLTVGVHPSWPWNCTENLLVKGMELAEKYNIQYATHLWEGPDEKRLADELWADEGGGIRHLKNIGLLNDRSLFFHCAVMDEREIDMLAEAGCSIVHNPSNNARKGDCAYLPYMLKTGITVGLGTDNPTSNMFKEILITYLIHNIMPRENRGTSPDLPITLATKGSARALWLDNMIGTLEPDKRADIITIDINRSVSFLPLNKGNLFHFICYNGAGFQVTDAMVDGVFLRRNNEFTLFDEEAILARAREWMDKYSHDFTRLLQENGSYYEKVHDEFIRI